MKLIKLTLFNGYPVYVNKDRVDAITLDEADPKMTRIVMGDLSVELFKGVRMIVKEPIDEVVWKIGREEE